eukprot:9736371-Alexandrium_andersonii.AAC.1
MFRLRNCTGATSRPLVTTLALTLKGTECGKRTMTLNTWAPGVSPTMTAWASWTEQRSILSFSLLGVLTQMPRTC